MQKTTDSTSVVESDVLGPQNAFTHESLERKKIKLISSKTFHVESQTYIRISDEQWWGGLCLRQAKQVLAQALWVTWMVGPLEELVQQWLFQTPNTHSGKTLTLEHKWENESHLDVVHHLQVEVVFGVLQNQSAAHVGRGVVEVKDDVIGFRTSFGSKYPVDLLSSLDLVGQVVSPRGTLAHTHWRTFNAYLL